MTRLLPALTRALIRFAEWRERRCEVRAGFWGHIVRSRRGLTIRDEIADVMARARRYTPPTVGDWP